MVWKNYNKRDMSIEEGSKLNRRLLSLILALAVFFSFAVAFADEWDDDEDFGDDEFEDEDDAWDDFEDNEEYWDEY